MSALKQRDRSNREPGPGSVLIHNRFDIEVEEIEQPERRN
jgi:hypothetical protein